MIIRKNKIIDQFPTPKHKEIWMPFWKLLAFIVIITRGDYSEMKRSS